MRHRSKDRENKNNLEPNINPFQFDSRHAPRQIYPQNLNYSSMRQPSPYQSQLRSTQKSDFFSTLTSQMRRIDENFSLEWSEDTPLQQALNCLICAIDTIEAERLENPPSYQDMTEPEANYPEDLKLRIDQLEATEAALQRERAILNSEKEKIKRLKDHYQSLEKDLKQQKQELEGKEKQDNEKIELIKLQLESELEEITEQKRVIERDSSEIELIKNKLDEYSTTLNQEREDLEKDRADLFEKKLEIEKERWDIESQKAQLEEKIAINNHLRDKIDQELQTLEQERSEILKIKIELQSEYFKGGSSKNLEEERLILQSEKLAIAEAKEKLLLEEEKFALMLAQFENDQAKLEKNKISVFEEREAADEVWNEIEEVQTGRKPDDYSAMLEELQQQMANYNQEIEAREKDIQLRNNELTQRELEVEKKLEEIQNAEFSLLRAKHDLEELSLGTIPELETQSQNIQHILADLLHKKNEVDTGYKQLQVRILEFERNKNLSRNSSDNRTSSEIENRIRKVREKEEELLVLEEEIKKEKKENLTHALFLQKAQKEFEEKCQIKEEEIEASAKKLSKLQSKLEAAIKLMNDKESELINMKEFILEERNKMTSP